MAADAVTPEYIIGKKDLFPNIAKLMQNGATCTYSAYVQKGYNGSYSSRQNWASIYTGLTPYEHGIDYDIKAAKEKSARMQNFDNIKPFWKILNDNGLTVGLWSPLCCNDPVKINGYVVSGKYEPIFSPQEDREANREITVCEKDKYILKYLKGEPPPRVYPKTLNQQGYTFEQLKQNPELVDKIANEDNFKPLLDNFRDELEYWFNSMSNAQRENPVDVIYLFTPTTDILAHFVLYSDDNPVLIKAYQLLDTYIGSFINEFNPDISIFMSDHGQQNFKYLVNCSNQNIQKEGFENRDKVIWLKNGYIAFEAKNGGLIFTAHSLKGLFIACGKGIKNTELKEMRTIDIYPTILEMFGVKIPEERHGYVMDIFLREIINIDKLLLYKDIIYKNIALIQTHEVSKVDIFINELYIENRFIKLTIIGEAKYEEIFRNNPRVSDFVPIEKINAKDFDEVYCGFFNKATSQMSHIRVI